MYTHIAENTEEMLTNSLTEDALPQLEWFQIPISFSS